MAGLTAQAQLQVQKARIPRILLGTSPFIGAGQFGSRAFQYYSHFYEHPENMVKIIGKSADLGVRGIHVFPYTPIVKAVKLAEHDLKLELTVLGTVRPEDPYGDIKILQGLRTVAMLLHAEITDSHNPNKINELLNQIRQSGSLAGVVTHTPLATLTWLQKADLEIGMIMLPFNKLGRFMDSTPDKTLEIARRIGKPLIGKKVLAAGELSPREGLEYAFKNGIKTVAIGISSEAEAEETFSIAHELSQKYPQ